MGAVFLAETVFVEVVRYICCFGVGVIRLVGAASIGIDHTVGVVKSRKSVIADRLIKMNVGLIAVQQICDFTAGELVGGFAAIFIFCVCKVIAIFD
nr:hypothetical protein [Ruminococcus callidus]